MRPRKGMTARRIVQLIEEQIAEADRLYARHAKSGNKVGMENSVHKRHTLSVLLYLIAEPQGKP